MNLHLTYTRAGDYLIPNIALGEPPRKPLGRYGLMRKEYLRQHKPVLWARLCTSGELYKHLLDVEAEAARQIEEMMPSLAEAAGANEDLKVRDPLRWAGLMNTCQAQAEEIVLRDLICC
ncbi:MAG: TnpV protein [Abditibacteriota bacterium]|nr:TnpV protein [Abditibacteriota bacterium]